MEPSSNPSYEFKSQKRMKTSKVWNIFDEDEVKETDTCRMCKHSMPHKNGTGLGHLVDT